MIDNVSIVIANTQKKSFHFSPNGLFVAKYADVSASSIRMMCVKLPTIEITYFNIYFTLNYPNDIVCGFSFGEDAT